MTTPLHARYQRLLALYPRGHRAVYADDMITTLMDDARPGQTRPRLRTSLDLIKGAAQAWALRACTKLVSWQRIGAPPAIALLALLLLVPRSFVAAIAVVQYPEFTPYRGPLAVVVLLPDLIWLPLTVAALLGLHRGAARLAIAIGVLWPLLNTVCGVSGWAPSFLDTPDRLPWLPVALIAAAGLSADGGARPGFRALGRTAGTAAVTGAVLIGVTGNSWLTPTPWAPAVTALTLGIGTALLALACLSTVARTSTGRTGTAALAVTTAVLGSGLYSWYDGGPSWSWQLQRSASLTLALTLLSCAVLVARASRTTTGETSPRPA